MKHIKVFDTHADYQSYITSDDIRVLPNLSYCKDQNETHNTPYFGEQLVITFNFKSSGVNSYKLMKDSTMLSQFSKIEIDGIELDTPVEEFPYMFRTAGEHIVKYTLEDPTTIGQNTFASIYTIVSIIIPNSVTEIGLQAFMALNTLKSLTIGVGVETIGTAAFSGCSKLTKLIIPATVSSIGLHAFNQCKSLTTIKIDGGNPIYDSRNNCNAIIETSTNKLIQGCKNTIIPDDVLIIGQDAFRSLDIESISLPDGVTTIDIQAFYGCSKLTNVHYVPSSSSLTTIGVSAFENCIKLEDFGQNSSNIQFSTNIVNINNAAFAGCTSLNKIINFGNNSNLDLGNNAFKDSAIKGITIGNIHSMGTGVFKNTKITNISASSLAGLTTIPVSTFENCEYLTTAVIYTNLELVNDYAFKGCINLESVTVYHDSPTDIQLGSEVFDNNKAGREIKVKQAVAEDFKAATGWSAYAEDIIGY